jgi:hypothetical protein
MSVMAVLLLVLEMLNVGLFIALILSHSFILDECKSQDIIIDMATWLLLDSDSVKSKNFD